MKPNNKSENQGNVGASSQGSSNNSFAAAANGTFNTFHDENRLRTAVRLYTTLDDTVVGGASDEGDSAAVVQAILGN